jgi:hypothetical protein
MPPADSDCPALAKARDYAILANHAYGEDPTLPAGYSFIDPDTEDGQAELSDLGIKPGELSPPASSFRAQVFRTDGPDGPHYVLSYRGTETLDNWKTNLQQGVGLTTDEYERAKKLATTLSSTTDGNISFTGHSLGGGLASAAAVVTGKPAITFNAAGLNENTVSGGYPPNPNVDAYYIPGEVLSTVQDGRAAALGIVAGVASIFIPLLGATLAGFVLANEVRGTPVLPPAYGNRQVLPVVPPDGKSWMDSHNPIDKHRMDWVKSGIDAKRSELGCE